MNIKQTAEILATRIAKIELGDHDDPYVLIIVELEKELQKQRDIGKKEGKVVYLGGCPVLEK